MTVGGYGILNSVSRPKTGVSVWGLVLALKYKKIRKVRTILILFARYTVDRPTLTELPLLCHSASDIFSRSVVGNDSYSSCVSNCRPSRKLDRHLKHWPVQGPATTNVDCVTIDGHLSTSLHWYIILGGLGFIPTVCTGYFLISYDMDGW